MGIPRQRARATSLCPACGQPIRAGAAIMLRFRHQDWVHARPSCLSSDHILVRDEGKVIDLNSIEHRARIDAAGQEA